jgi:flagellar protein FlbD
MIPVTRLDGSVMVVNDEQIAWIETRPDTVISMMNGEKVLVRETADTLVERTRDFKRSLLGRASFDVARHAISLMESPSFHPAAAGDHGEDA